jgi:hypothetical protein
MISLFTVPPVYLRAPVWEMREVAANSTDSILREMWIPDRAVNGRCDGGQW